MNAVIVDDERLARSELRRLLISHPHIRIIGEATNIIEAQQLIEAEKPELVFLDIQMPGGTGFDLLSNLDHIPQIIFTTAYDTYAMRAFEVNALDYLLKPIEANRLAHALQRVHSKKNHIADVQKSQNTVAQEEKLFIKDGERCWFVAITDIALFESEGNYTRVYFEDQRPLFLRSLNQLEQKLDSSIFIRSSRQHIVNLQFVKQMSSTASGGLELLLKSGQKIEMSRRRATEFKQANRF